MERKYVFMSPRRPPKPRARDRVDTPPLVEVEDLDNLSQAMRQLDLSPSAHSEADRTETNREGHDEQKDNLRFDTPPPRSRLHMTPTPIKPAPPTPGELVAAREQLALMYGTSPALESMSMEELRDLANDLEASLGKIRVIMAGKTSISVCVVCQEHARDIVLLPCRHLCLCSECNDQIGEQCPLCRVVIQRAVKVFM